MNAPLFIAQKYFLLGRRKNFIQIISLLSMLGVAMASLSLIIVLSVFNGLEGLIRSVYKSFDADLKVQPLKGKTFDIHQFPVSLIEKTDGVLAVYQVVEDNVLLRYGDKQMVVKVKGVPSHYFYRTRTDTILKQGSKELVKGTNYFAIVGRGVQYNLNIALENDEKPLQLWYPKLTQKQILDPEKAFNRENVWPGGVFAVEKQYDDSYIFIALDKIRQLMEYGTQRSYLEVMVRDVDQIQQVKAKIKEVVGPQFAVLDSEEQHTSLLKAIKTEKIFVFITFLFILAVACLNILFSLTMLAIEKKKDISVLQALGATSGQIKSIFLWEGLFIGMVGTVLGLFIGYSICALQQKFGFVSMGMQTALVDAYPVQMQLVDFLGVGFCVLSITFLFSYKPALQASKY